MTPQKQATRYGVSPPTVPGPVKVSPAQREALLRDKLMHQTTPNVIELARTLGVHTATVYNDLLRLRQERGVNTPAPSPRQARAQRLDQLMRLLSAHEELTVATLATHANVHDVTVRRDLEYLTHLKLVVRDGPYVARAQALPSLPFDVRRTMQADTKTALANQTLTYLRRGMRVGLDASTTALEFARLVSDLTLTVYTTGLEAAQLLAERGVPVVLLGGPVNFEHCCVATTEAALTGLHLDMTVFSCSACSARRGYQEVTADEALSKRALLTRAKLRVALLDQAKLGAQAAHLVAAPEEVDVLISDAPASRLAGLAARGTSGP